MTIIVIAIIALTAISAWGTYHFDDMPPAAQIAFTLGLAIGLTGLFIYALMGSIYISAGYKADVINREHGTSYSQAEVFYAGGVISKAIQCKSD